MSELGGLKAALQARVDEILATMESPDMTELPKLLQSTRARVLMDVIECIDQMPCSTAAELRKQAADSWRGQVDRQGGSFDDSEILSRTEWR